MVKINFSGGIAYTGQLKSIIDCIETIDIKTIKFGLRQQMILDCDAENWPFIENILKENKLTYSYNDAHVPNVVSSYVAEDVFQKGNWLTEGIYKDIIDALDFELKLKINISDNDQSFTPFFSGHLNFIASETPNFWFLSVRLPRSNKIISCPILIFSTEIAKCVHFLQNHIHENTTELNSIFNQLPVLISSLKNTELELPKFTLPYYEGLNRYGKMSWLGIYSRMEVFSVKFLKEICKLCIETKIGELCITPWKSIIIKNISEPNRELWSALLAKYNINVRHAANELNWQVEDESEFALKLKNELSNYFNEIDIRTFGICFGIKTKPKTEVFASIMVQKRPFLLFKTIPLFNVYDISYTEDFDPNGRRKVYFDRGILKINLKETLRRSVLFYNKQSAENKIFISKSDLTENTIISSSPIAAMQCRVCFSQYHQKYGDELAGIPAGIIFENLPSNYKCGVCENTKDKFVEIMVE